MQGQIAVLRQKMSDLKEFLQEFVGFMVLEVSRATEKPLVLHLEAASRSSG
jgi:hypothetical protein